MDIANIPIWNILKKKLTTLVLSNMEQVNLGNFEMAMRKNQKRQSLSYLGISTEQLLATLRSKETLRAEIWWPFYEIQISISSQNQKIRLKLARKYRDDDTNSSRMFSDLMRPIFISTKLIEMPRLEKTKKMFLLTIV